MSDRLSLSLDIESFNVRFSDEPASSSENSALDASVLLTSHLTGLSELVPTQYPLGRNPSWTYFMTLNGLYISAFPKR